MVAVRQISGLAATRPPLFHWRYLTALRASILRKTKSKITSLTDRFLIALLDHCVQKGRAEMVDFPDETERQENASVR